MKLHGKELKLRQAITCTVKLTDGTDAELKLGAVPITFPVDVQMVLPTPIAPRGGKMARDKNGKLMRDASGESFRESLEDHPAYVRAQAMHNILYSTYLIYSSLKVGDPKQLEFDVENQYKAADKEPDKEFVEAIANEFAAAGFDATVFAILAARAGSVNGLDSIEDVVATDFSRNSKRAAGKGKPKKK